MEIFSESKNHPFKIGQKIFARLATYHISGEIIAIDGMWLTLKDAAWIADSGRFSDFLNGSPPSEVEPFVEEVYINLNSAIDVTTIESLPKDQT